MKLRNPHVWIGVFSAVAVLCVALVDVGRPSPGPLATVHHRESDLEGSWGCAECHGGWTSTMSASCMDCHGDVEEHIETGRGLHGTLDPDRAKRCATCHSEHHGNDFAIVNLQSFVKAGIAEPEEFDHELIGWRMEGAHLELGCTECHEHADARVLPRDARRYMGLESDCATCHDDPHEGRMTVGCASCHGQSDFESLHSLGHEEHLPLIGGHAESSCRDCHARDDTHSLERLGSRNRPESRDCVSCHESPHADPFVEGVARLLKQSAGASCAACHEAPHTSFRDEDLELTKWQHGMSGFKLNLPHDEVGCEECHAPELPTFEERYPGRLADDCAACHEDPHGGQFDEGPFAGAGCIACHERVHFDPHAFTPQKHMRASMPLDGAHLGLECSECHQVEREGEPRVFRGTPTSCNDCHTDAHRGFFQSDVSCQVCHPTSSFSDYHESEFDHGRWTGFAVLGAHAQSDCASCHPSSHAPDEHGRTFGFVAEHFGAYEGCVTCHEDPHLGQFDLPGMPREVDERQDCARCHVPTSFRVIADDFDHQAWTRFALDGAHATAACTSCHEPLRTADEHGRTWGRAAGRTCADCHTDPHRGQFEKRGSTACIRCHTSAEAFTALRFDHDRDARFALDEAHEDIACAECHKPSEEDGFVRYRPLPMKCSDCHGVQESALRKRIGGKQ